MCKCGFETNKLSLCDLGSLEFKVSNHNSLSTTPNRNSYIYVGLTRTRPLHQKIFLFLICNTQQFKYNPSYMCRVEPICCEKTGLGLWFLLLDFLMSYLILDQPNIDRPYRIGFSIKWYVLVGSQIPIIIYIITYTCTNILHITHNFWWISHILEV